MNKRNRVFTGILLIFTLGIGFLIYSIADDLDIRYRESTEQVMVDTAYILAAWLETESIDGKLQAVRLQRAFDQVYERKFSAQIYAVTKHRVDLRAHVTDLNGTVIFDSLKQDDGKDFRNWHDINLALAGRYGARTTRNNPDDPATTVMYVAVPIYQADKIIGAVSVSKPVAAHRELLLSAQEKLAAFGLFTLASLIVLVFTVSLWLTNPTRLTHDVIQVFKQEKLSRPARLLTRLRAVFNHAFLDMRDAMAGRNFSEDYLQALTHELKSPLTAIRGAAELIREPMTDAQRERFTNNIAAQSRRLQDLVERLLELTGLEKRRGLDNPQQIDLHALLTCIVEDLEIPAKQKNLTFVLNLRQPASIMGDEFLLRQALTNLLDNALDFSAPDSSIEIALKPAKKSCRISIRDHGPGIPDYAKDRLFDKFYSLHRPDTGQKGTGLGLPFVREIVQLHGGQVSLTNDAGGGAIAIIKLPVHS